MFEARKPSALRLILIAAVAFLLLIAEVLSFYPRVITPTQRGDFAARDVAMRLRGTRPPGGEVVIVAIDDFSFNWTGYQWPWPRAYLAEIVSYLNQAGARVIGLDILLFEPDPDPQGDEALARALAEASHAVTVVQIFRSPEQHTETLKLPLSIYRQAVDGMGITSLVLDKDAIARGIPAFDTYAGEVYPNWAFEVVRLYLNGDLMTDPSPRAVTFCGRRVPLQNGILLVNFAGPPGTIPTYSAARLLLGDYPPEAFRDRIVLIGATSTTLQDVYPTPFSTQVRMPGVEIIANAVETLLSENYLRLPVPWVNVLAVLLAALAAALIVRVRRADVAIALMAIVMLSYGVLDYFVFVRQGVFLPFTAPELMLFLGVLLPTVERSVFQEMERRRLRNLMIRFLSPEVVDQLIATRDIRSLNKRANLTILFADIRGFTTLSEKLAPEEVVALLNPYLEAMTAVIYKHGGTVDKYEGDAILAFFGEPVPDPNHARHAVRAAVDMRHALAELKQRWAAQGKAMQEFEMGIGINSGEVFVGLLGSAQRVNYTVIGDNVNLAARLQDLTKEVGWPILISESTCLQVQDEFEVEFVDSVIVRGKTEPVNVYKVLGRKLGRA